MTYNSHIIFLVSLSDVLNFQQFLAEFSALSRGYCTLNQNLKLKVKIRATFKGELGFIQGGVLEDQKH